MIPSPQLPVFYINLDSRPDRRAFMEAQFARLGIAAQRVPAVTVAQVPASLTDHHTDPGILWPVSNADLACGLSHQAIWRRMVDEQISAALILEDDALLADNLADFLATDIAKRLGADLLKLETRRNRVLLGPAAAAIGDVELRELQSSQMGSAAYVISLSAATASLTHPLVNAMSVDRFLFGKGGAHLLHSRILQAVPSPAIQLDRLEGHARRNASPASRSDIADARRKHPGRHGPPNLGGLLSLNLAHAARLIRLATRDPGAIRRARRRVPFAADAAIAEA